MATLHRPFIPRGWIIVFTSLVMLGVMAIGMFFMTENYFFLAPAIDTRFAPGYSEQAFQAIQPGMTQAQVIELLGPPLNANPLRDQSWSYSEDGAFGLWDFAWLGRSVSFDEQGKVLGTRTYVAHD